MNSRLVEWICPFPSTDLSVFPFLVGVEAFRFRFCLCTDFFFPFLFCLQTFPCHLQIRIGIAPISRCVSFYIFWYFLCEENREIHFVSWLSWFNCVPFISFQLSFGSLAMNPQEIEEVKSELKTAENDMELRQNEQGTSRMQEKSGECLENASRYHGKIWKAGCKFWVGLWSLSESIWVYLFILWFQLCKLWHWPDCSRSAEILKDQKRTQESGSLETQLWCGVEALYNLH